MPNPPPASTRNPAFQSKLEPYREFIRECRAKRWSYPRIAAALREEHGLSLAPSTIFSFVKVRAKRRRLYAQSRQDFDDEVLSRLGPRKRVAWLRSRAAGNPGSPFRHSQSPALAGNPAWTGTIARRGAEESRVFNLISHIVSSSSNGWQSSSSGLTPPPATWFRPRKPKH
jgi:hypothetical protein